jgi:hypothetical protein
MRGLDPRIHPASQKDGSPGQAGDDVEMVVQKGSTPQGAAT